MYRCRCHGATIIGVREEKIQARVCLTDLSVMYRCQCHGAMIIGVHYKKIRVRVCLTVGTKYGVRISRSLNPNHRNPEVRSPMENRRVIARY